MKQFNKVISFYYFLYISINVFTAVSGSALRQENEFELSLIHFNDFHARFEESSPSSTKCVPENHQCIGGFPRLYSGVTKLMAEQPNPVLLNAGDDFQGTLWYNVLKWNVTQYFMNLLPMDAHALGNHEFDDGVEGVVPYLEAMKAPALVSNMDVSEEPTLQGLFNDSVIIERSGIKIGLTGVILKTTDELASTGKVIFTDEIEGVRRVASDLKSQGINIIIVISHCGIEIDKEIAVSVTDVDIIVGGHSHTLLYPKGETPPSGENAYDDYPIVVEQTTGTKALIVQASAYTKYLGNLQIKFDSNGVVQSWTGKPIYLDESVPQNEDILELMKPFKAEVDAIGQLPLGQSLVLLDRSNCFNGDCNIGNFVTDAFVEYCVGRGSEGTWTLASIGLINTGGIRTDISQGNITYEDLILSQPFGNSIQTFELKGEYLLEALEYSVSSWTRIQVSGLHVVFNMTKDIGERVVSVKVRCAQCDIPTYLDLKYDAIYYVVAPNFLANGGDGYTSISDNKINAVDRALDVDVLTEYIGRHTPLYSEIDERIVMVL